MARPVSGKLPELSFVIPIKNEEGNIKTLTREIKAVCSAIKKTYEILLIDDGSTDKSYKVVKILSKPDSAIRGIKLRGNFGKTTALSVGFAYSRGGIIFTLDGDSQDNPAEIPKFLEKLKEGYDLVSGWKKERHDPITKTLPSKLGNWITRTLTGIKIHDLNCGYKAYKREVTQNLSLYGELYKFIPIIAAKQNYKVGEVIVRHRKRVQGKSKFGWERNIKGFLDIITIVFLTTYLHKPAHFFGTLGIIFFIPGFLIGLYITYLRISTGGVAYRYPLLFLGALLMIVGIQFISTGLIAEMIINSRGKEDTGKFIAETTN